MPTRPRYAGLLVRVPGRCWRRSMPTTFTDSTKPAASKLSNWQPVSACSGSSTSISFPMPSMSLAPASGPDGVDGPQRHRCAKMRVVRTGRKGAARNEHHHDRP